MKKITSIVAAALLLMSVSGFTYAQKTTAKAPVKKEVKAHTPKKHAKKHHHAKKATAPKAK